jgi:5-methylcytosine-specific restriction protein B
LQIRVNALLWRICNGATFDSLHGRSKGQYDIRLSTDPRIATFFDGLPHDEPTELGGYTLHVPIAAFTGPGAVPAMTLDVRYMGQTSQRKDWNIPAQRPETAYPLWRPGRGIPDTVAASAGDYVLLVRDTFGSFHARWLRGANLPLLPPRVREAILAEGVGVQTL